jgi:hypothetical protein
MQTERSRGRIIVADSEYQQASIEYINEYIEMTKYLFDERKMVAVLMLNRRIADTHVEMSPAPRLCDNRQITVTTGVVDEVEMNGCGKLLGDTTLGRPKCPMCNLVLESARVRDAIPLAERCAHHYLLVHLCLRLRLNPQVLWIPGEVRRGYVLSKNGALVR